MSQNIEVYVNSPFESKLISPHIDMLDLVYKIVGQDRYEGSRKDLKREYAKIYNKYFNELIPCNILIFHIHNKAIQSRDCKGVTVDEIAGIVRELFGIYYEDNGENGS